MSASFPPPPEDTINPYAAPATEIGSEPTGLDADLAEVEAIRRAHLGHEASIQSVGSLHYLGAILGVLSLAGGLAWGDPALRSSVGRTIMVVFYLFAIALNFALGYGLRSLKPWARWTETALLSIQMVTLIVGVMGALALGIPPLMLGYLVMGLIVGYILYLLLSPKGSVVFSPAYKEIIARTPHIKYRTSLILKIVLALFVSLIGMAIVGAILSSR
jgi:hypothetical protein